MLTLINYFRVQHIEGNKTRLIQEEEERKTCEGSHVM